MRQSRTAQLILQSAYVALGVVAALGSTGLFRAEPSPSFYTKFTNISNYLCLAIMAAELLQTARREGDGPVTFSPIWKFIGVLSILLTFFVFNIMLLPARTLAENLDVTSVLCHQVLPVLYVADWLCFYRRGDLKATDPLRAAAVPLAYVAFIFARAAALGFAGDDLYPYFFLDLGALGADGVAFWVAVLTVAFLVVGLLLYAYDRVAARRSVRRAASAGRARPAAEV